jgi:hypothetical protein
VVVRGTLTLTGFINWELGIQWMDSFHSIFSSATTSAQLNHDIVDPKRCLARIPAPKRSTKLDLHRPSPVRDNNLDDGAEPWRPRRLTPATSWPIPKCK